MPAKSPAKPRKAAMKSGRSRTASSGAPRAAKPKLLSGGNPQIPKGEGDAPVQAFIEAMPEWKRDIGRRIDEIIVRTVPGVRKAVKWNSPFFGIGEAGYFTAFHCFDKYVKVTFFRGTSLERAHEVAHRLQDEIVHQIGNADVLIHLEPEDRVRPEDDDALSAG